MVIFIPCLWSPYSHFYFLHKRQLGKNSFSMMIGFSVINQSLLLENSLLYSTHVLRKNNNIYMGGRKKKVIRKRVQKIVIQVSSFIHSQSNSSSSKSASYIQNEESEERAGEYKQYKKKESSCERGEARQYERIGRERMERMVGPGQQIDRSRNHCERISQILSRACLLFILASFLAFITANYVSNNNQTSLEIQQRQSSLPTISDYIIQQSNLNEQVQHASPVIQQATIQDETTKLHEAIESQTNYKSQDAARQKKLIDENSQANRIKLQGQGNPLEEVRRLDRFKPINSESEEEQVFDSLEAIEQEQVPVHEERQIPQLEVEQAAPIKEIKFQNHEDDQQMKAHFQAELNELLDTTTYNLRHPPNRRQNQPARVVGSNWHLEEVENESRVDVAQLRIDLAERQQQGQERIPTRELRDRRHFQTGHQRRLEVQQKVIDPLRREPQILDGYANIHILEEFQELVRRITQPLRILFSLYPEADNEDISQNMSEMTDFGYLEEQEAEFDP